MKRWLWIVAMCASIVPLAAQVAKTHYNSTSPGHASSKGERVDRGAASTARPTGNSKATKNSSQELDRLEQEQSHVSSASRQPKAAPKATLPATNQHTSSEHMPPINFGQHAGNKKNASPSSGTSAQRPH